MERSVPLPVAGGRAAMRLSRLPLRPAAPTASLISSKQKTDSLAAQLLPSCFAMRERNALPLQMPHYCDAIRRKRNRRAFCPQLYGSLAPSMLFAPVCPCDSTCDRARFAKGGLLRRHALNLHGRWLKRTNVRAT